MQRLPDAQSDGDSSDDDAPVDTDSILESVFCSYAGDSSIIGERTKEAVANSGPCLICISKLKRDDAVWSCDSCHCTFHLNCVQRWANDCIYQQKNSDADEAANGSDSGRPLEWACPKCRTTRQPIPRKYVCYCGKVDDPPFDPWILPHSCGETCKKPLKPTCGHVCLILCHPGPCPPCPKMVKSDCHCGRSAPAVRRCYERQWSCGKPCGRTLDCGQHPCPQTCHQGPCQPCQKTSVQLCRCQRHQRQCDCASPSWTCDDTCGKPLACGHHLCDVVCHPGACPACPLSQTRTCPCGKTRHHLPCYEATPTCGNTCGKTLLCGDHVCAERCHRGKCGSCLQMAKKTCKCGAKTRDMACAKKEFACETKCKRLRDCGKHACNRKCCDPTTCPPPCDQPCNKTLSCKNHKCPSRCHPGRCYPCSQTQEVSCRCGQSRVLVPCGLERSTKPPQCKSKCRASSDCHHAQRVPHSCHFGACPPCKQPCQLELGCGHRCPTPCHDNVKVNVESNKKAATPWEAGGAKTEVRRLDCPDCQLPVSVTCLGGHETSDWPCHVAKSSSCQRGCGRQLPCGNHVCERSCHRVKNAPDDVHCGSNCRKCESACLRPRPEGCHHPCLKPCHPEACETCPQIIRIRCHCGMSQLYVKCGEWIAASPQSKVELGCCKDQCPKLLSCGHRSVIFFFNRNV